ncbi:MAG: pantoate--beta-alanine ligase, partial [Fibrobacter sp.]|nr:pantoate--beta-alanine ligase [Fibrobacter sp.]
MKIVRTVTEMKNLSLMVNKTGRTIGFVPTMGALHEGHLSLLKIAQENADFVVMSIFVNPTQFGPNEDFDKYPRVLEQDCAKASEAGCDVIFAPSVEQMYPEGYSTYVDVGDITTRLCGASRPNHFRGVTTVVMKLLNIVMPQCAVFGQKDAQQVLVLKRMLRDLNCS